MVEKKFEYYKGGESSKGHTPIYKMHKYFARRPHNVFKAIIEHYSKPGALIFDPFAGGGVTLIEGLTTNRRIICSDTNPVASFIQYCQTLNVNISEFEQVSSKLNKKVIEKFGGKMSTACEECHSQAHVRWFEHAYLVNCPTCNNITSLENKNQKIKSDGKAQPGKYSCEHCGETIQAVNVKRIDSKLISLRYKCNACGTHKNKTPDEFDRQNFEFFKINEKSLISSLSLYIPEDEIPSYWDRQQEDCLHRKGFLKFRDLFTKRNLVISAYYFKCLEEEKDKISDNLYLFIAFNISALLRYTNNMNFSTSAWMDGRPVAWAKHAYWTPNQFIEVNPTEYFSNRIKASISGLKDQQGRFKNKHSSLSLNEFIDNKADYLIACSDSSKLELPTNLVDLVVTDPPYGSNVQYSELCGFWYVWLVKIIPFKVNDFFFSDEAVVHRKSKSKNYVKTFESYNYKLSEVFAKCYQSLKPGGCLVFTFNNKNIAAWYSVIKATIDSGFYLEADGVIYQEPIDAYKDTAHQRFDGTPQGDYIYTFRKASGLNNELNEIMSFDESLDYTVRALLKRKEEFSLHEFMIKLFGNSTLSIIDHIKQKRTDQYIYSLFETDRIIEYLKLNHNIEFNANRYIPKFDKENCEV